MQKSEVIDNHRHGHHVQYRVYATRLPNTPTSGKNYVKLDLRLYTSNLHVINHLNKKRSTIWLIHIVTIVIGSSCDSN
jgi:hypothetical protein